MARPEAHAPHISRDVQLDLIGDWGIAAFHKVLGWLTYQFCNHAGPRSRTKIWSVYGGGAHALQEVHDGQADLCIVTPAKLIAGCSMGQGMFTEARLGPLPRLRALAVLPQRDRFVLAVHPSVGVDSYAAIRAQKPALEIAVSEDDGTSFIGYVTTTLLAAHGITADLLTKWGGHFHTSKNPHGCLAAALNGTANAIAQEAVMLDQWNELIDERGWIPIPVEERAMQSLSSEPGFEPATITSEHWSTATTPIPAIDFADLLLVVREDMHDDVARLLTWCLVYQRHGLEDQFNHIPARKCSITYPISVKAMAKSPIKLHDAAQRVYEEAGAL